jgi:hypothetical protein
MHAAAAAAVLSAALSTRALTATPTPAPHVLKRAMTSTAIAAALLSRIPTTESLLLQRQYVLMTSTHQPTAMSWAQAQLKSSLSEEGQAAMRRASVMWESSFSLPPSDCIAILMTIQMLEASCPCLSDHQAALVCVRWMYIMFEMNISSSGAATRNSRSISNGDEQPAAKRQRCISGAAHTACACTAPFMVRFICSPTGLLDCTTWGSVV